MLMGVCSAEFSLLANGNFILKFVFPDASQLFDAESLSQQEGPVLAAERPCPLLKTTSSFPHGRHHIMVLCCCRSPCPPSAALSSPLICPCGWCTFSLPSEPFFCLFCCLPAFYQPFYQPGCSSSIFGELEEEST